MDDSGGAFFVGGVSSQKKGLKISSQKTIVEHFSIMDKTTLLTEFIDDGNIDALKNAIAYCLKH